MQSVLGVQSNQTVRVIGGILLAMDALGSISRDEMMAGLGQIVVCEDSRSEPRKWGPLISAPGIKAE